MSLAERATRLTAWAIEEATRRGFVPAGNELLPVSGDASFRRYFRLPLAEGRPPHGSLIAVDAPPDKENLRPFVAIARALCGNGTRAPEVLAVDHAQGFMLLEDFGDRLLLPALSAGSADALYTLAMRELVRMQDVVDVHGYALPPYDRARLVAEMELFRDWFVKVHLQLELSADELAVLDGACALIADDNLAQPTVFVHRDYHSRNLMLLDDAADELGIIDFQDAVTGPVTYDLVSLLRDAYVTWPAERVAGWARQFARMLRDERRIDVDDATFLRWFDWMGAQRHLKVVGIFARLNHRDGKAGYLDDIPRVFAYLLAEIRDYPQLAPLSQLLRERIVPAYLAKTPSAASALG